MKVKLLWPCRRTWVIWGKRKALMECFRNSHVGWCLFCCILLCWNNILLWGSKRLTQAAVLLHRVIKMNTMQIFFASQRFPQLFPPLPTYSFGWEFFHSIVPESLHWCVCITVFTLQMTDTDLHIKRQPSKPHAWWTASLDLDKNVRPKHHFLAVSFLVWCGSKLNLFL